MSIVLHLASEAVQILLLLRSCDLREASRLAKVGPLSDFLAFCSSVGAKISLRSCWEAENGHMLIICFAIYYRFARSRLCPVPRAMQRGSGRSGAPVHAAWLCVVCSAVARIVKEERMSDRSVRHVGA